MSPHASVPRMDRNEMRRAVHGVTRIGSRLKVAHHQLDLLARGETT